jgi:transcriptional regulator with XRE-family HTH domain
VEILDLRTLPPGLALRLRRVRLGHSLESLAPLAGVSVARLSEVERDSQRVTGKRLATLRVKVEGALAALEAEQAGAAA